MRPNAKENRQGIPRREYNCKNIERQISFHVHTFPLQAVPYGGYKLTENLPKTCDIGGVFFAWNDCIFVWKYVRWKLLVGFIERKKKVVLQFQKVSNSTIISVCRKPNNGKDSSSCMFQMSQYFAPYLHITYTLSVKLIFYFPESRFQHSFPWSYI